MARGPAVKIILGDSERSELEMRARRRKIARVDAVRAEIVLLAADGMKQLRDRGHTRRLPADCRTMAKAVCQKALRWP